MIMNKKLIMLSIGVVLISGCIGQTPTSDKDKAISECKQECKDKLEANLDLSNGPCLLDPVPNLPDWVCDVAHEPRQSVDNQPENQCSSFREGKAHHFVEVDTNCELIRSS
jgi:hypothetical protein